MGNLLGANTIYLWYCGDVLAMNHADKRNRKRNSEEKLQAFYGTVKFHFYWMALGIRIFYTAITSPSAQQEKGIRRNKNSSFLTIVQVKRNGHIRNSDLGYGATCLSTHPSELKSRYCPFRTSVCAVRQTPVSGKHIYKGAPPI